MLQLHFHATAVETMPSSSDRQLPSVQKLGMTTLWYVHVSGCVYMSWCVLCMYASIYVHQSRQLTRQAVEEMHGACARNDFTRNADKLQLPSLLHLAQCIHI